MRSWKRWVVAACLVGLAAAGATTRRASACGGIGFFAINCDGIIIANQITQIGHMVTQISRMVEQLGSLSGILDGVDQTLGMTQQLVQSDSPTMGNLGRLRDAVDRLREMELQGVGLSSAGGVVGAFSQRIPGVTDQAGWLEELAAAEAGLVSGAFGSWAVPDQTSRDVLESLRLMATGTQSFQGIWTDMEADAPAVLAEADVRALTDDVAVQDRLVERHERTEEAASARLVHTHAEAEAASAVAALVDEASAVLTDLRADDLMTLQRLEQAQLTAAVTEAELRLAEAQLAAYQAARGAQERYEAEAARRAERARWQADVVAAAAAWDQRTAADEAGSDDRRTGHRYFPSSADWTW